MARRFLAPLFGLLAAEPPRRIVSLNKCTDQLLLALVERERIASVSPIGSDELSFSAKALRGLPANSGRGESVLLTNADLVLTGPFESHARRDMLRRQGFEVLVLGLWTSLAEGREQIRVLVLQRRGYTPGDTSILDELLRHVGLVPATRWLGLAQGGTVSLERLVADPPDYLLMAESDRGATDQGSALLWHPALRATIPPERRLYLPDRLTICGGPATPQAIDALAAEVRAKVR